jgi:protein-disulfide isomerase
MRFTLALAPILLLAGCGGDEPLVNESAPAAPVAAATPPAGQQWVDVVVKTPEGGYRMGNPNAPIKLVEYGSRTCHVCQEFDEQGMEPLKSQFISTGKVSYEFRDFLRNGADLSAALVGQCGGPGTFFVLLDQMYDEQPATLERLQKLPESFYTQLQSQPPAQQSVMFAEAAGYLDFVKQRGIPDAQARQCLADAAVGDALTKSTQDAVTNKQVQGTPTFFINDKVVPNTVNWQQVQQALRAAGG